LTISVSGAPDFVVVCNCTECQRRTGSVFGVGAYYNAKALVRSRAGTQRSVERQSPAVR
jgi:hypothetical protein